MSLFFRGDHAVLHAVGRAHGVVELTPAGVVLSANDPYLRLLGYTLDEVRGRSLDALLDPQEARSDEQQELWAAVIRGECRTACSRHLTKQGVELWLQVSYCPVLGRAGRTTKISQFSMDVTVQQQRSADQAAVLQAISCSRATIEFALDGTILTANPNFLNTVGYSLEEIQGRHHSLFVAPAERESQAYRDFWAALTRGEFQRAEYKRFGKGGREVWLQAIYNPVRNSQGKPYKVVKFATDITQDKLHRADVAGQIAAINRSQGVIHFDMDGTILDANENFLGVVGYRLDEVRGQHHRTFVEPSHAQSADYLQLWEALRRGEYQAGVFKRVGKGGRPVWIQASYNPIFDADGKPFKVVKYATDITAKTAAQHAATGASGQTLMNVQTVASAAEELSASIGEIAQSLARSRSEVDAIHDQTVVADRSTAKLKEAAASMNGVVQLIQGVGQQINLLALNATIEAARAGEAGRGFAVVAGEVKNLSNQVTQATSRIAQDITGMQEIAEEVAGALLSIVQAIGSVRGTVTGVASAVEEQSAVTQEISSSMQTAAQGVGEINTSLQALTG
ncbi:PAS domain-containing methyl-accepting chemotaxis protein [Methylobacterium sp. R2-1]|uniref:methyl-accepting chemotaxis protein n=1 Tax=Methylobacterium sp. R2-1 TaxID=2587064 RepID=UPI00161A1D32|nr:PAS domain-containing methyl-accepting chemotaxis protein [Methylobacterium sp. R2-1]MBB2964569.1 methyl-accepting chemotaxis protein [Methylobacterium sp. R2-1]